jgi:hypothetical protein
MSRNYILEYENLKEYEYQASLEGPEDEDEEGPEEDEEEEEE